MHALRSRRSSAIEAVLELGASWSEAIANLLSCPGFRGSHLVDLSN